MKKVKYFIWFIILAFLGILIYQNQDYFLTKQIIKFKLIQWELALPEIQNIAYWGICLFLGLVLAGIKGIFVVLHLKRELKQKNTHLSNTEKEISELKKELDSFKNDPYIKKGLDESTQSGQKPEEKVKPIQEPYKSEKTNESELQPLNSNLSHNA